MRKITLIMAIATTFLTVSQVFAQTARMQAVHNSPDAALSVIDVYLGDIRIIDNIGYKVATPFLDAPAGIPLTFTIAPGNSMSVADGIYSKTVTLDEGMGYIFVADGINSENGYSVEPNFSLELYGNASETGFTDGYTSILVHHGSPDLGGATVSETGVGLGMFLYDMPYPQFTVGYFNLPTMNYVIEVRKTADNSVVGSYNAPFATLGMEVQATLVIATGFAHPENNSNGEPFGLFMVPPAGGFFIPMEDTMGNGEMVKGLVTVYPNPAADVINISVPQGYSELENRFYDTAGREIHRSSGINRIDVSGLGNGLYLLHIMVDGKVQKEKITINR